MAGNDNMPVASDRLRAIVEKIEGLEAERKQAAELIKDELTVAKGEGFDTKTIRRILRLRKMKPADRAEQADLLSVYASALGLKDILL